MKILFLNHNLIGRGTYFRCMGFARELVKRGHEVDLWTCSREFNLLGNRFEEAGVRVWQTPRWGGLGAHDGGYAPVDNLIRLMRTMRGRWDVVHAFDHRPNVLLPWLSLKTRFQILQRNAVFAADWCDWWAAGGITTSRRRFAFIDRIEQRIEEGSKRIADGVTVISSVLERRALEAGVKRERLLLLPSGVDVERFPLLDQTQCRQDLDLPANRLILGFVGFSLWDMELLADAFERIRAQIPSALLLAIGGGVEEEAKNVFRRRFTIGQDVLLPGVVPFSEIPRYLCACDIQLLPLNDNAANRARLPNKLCDYLAAGRPIVASDVGESGDIIKNRKIGLAAREGAKGMADACLQLLANPGQMENYGRQARKMAETDFSFKNLSEKMDDFYRELKNGRSLLGNNRRACESP